MNPESIAAILRASVPELGIESIELIGEGDYCQAFALNREWIFLVAKNPEASRSLERAVALLPTLAPTLPLPIPEITYHGEAAADFGASTFVGYRKIHGIELTSDRYQALPPQEGIRSSLIVAVIPSCTLRRRIHLTNLPKTRSRSISGRKLRTSASSRKSAVFQ